MEELLNKLKELGAIRAIGDYADYEPDGKHKDTIYFAEDEEKIYLNGKNYGGKQEEIDISGLLEDYAKTSDLNDYVQKENGKVLSSNDYTDEDKAKVAIIDDKVDKVDGKQLSTNDYTDTDKAKVDNTYTKTEVDNRVENRVAILSEVWDAQLEDAFNNLDNKKVDKVTGKQLSTEDFTTLLKQKLEQLAIDVPDIDARLTQLKTTLDTLIDDGGIDAVINSFIEVQNFLAGITNQQTLAGMLLDLRNDIISLCASTYAKKSESAVFSNVGDICTRMNLTEDLALLAKNGYIELYQDNVGWLNIKAGKYILQNGTSSQFLKADGSVDGTAYLPTASYTASDVLDKVKSVDGTGSGLDADLLDGKHNGELTTLNFKSYSKGTDDKYNANEGNGAIVSNYGSYNGWIGTPTGFSYGSVFKITSDDTNVIPCQFAWDINHNSTNATKSLWFRAYNNLGWDSTWHQIAFTDSNVASADKLTTKQLTNEDLNTLILAEASFTIYHAVSSNTCANKPSGVTNFSLHLIKVDSNPRTRQVLYADNSTYSRFWNGSSWTPWQQLATTDGAVAKLTTKQLTNEDLNTIKDSDFSSYYAPIAENTCSNKPNGVTAFNLQVLSISQNHRAQILTDLNGNVYRRHWNTVSWSAWKKMLTEDDIANLSTGPNISEPMTAQEYANLATKDPNTLYLIKEE